MAPRIWEQAMMEAGRAHERLDSLDQKVGSLMATQDDLKQVMAELGPLLDDLDTVLPALRQADTDGVTGGQLQSLGERLGPLRARVDAFNRSGEIPAEPAPAEESSPAETPDQAPAEPASQAAEQESTPAKPAGKRKTADSGS